MSDRDLDAEYAALKSLTEATIGERNATIAAQRATIEAQAEALQLLRDYVHRAGRYWDAIREVLREP